MPTITLHQLDQYLQNLLKCSAIPDSCFNGVQVEGASEIKQIATAVSASLEAIKSAAEKGVQALIVHHGLFWNGDSYSVTGSKREKLRILIENNISLLAYHLPLDMHPEFGNNWKAAYDMGWTELQPFGMYKGNAIGVKGKIPKMGRDQFQKELEKYYGHHAAVALGGKKQVETVGLISGGAYKSIGEAASLGLDCFVTGNFDEPAWNQAFEEKINFFALGHSATEKVGPKALGEHLQEQLRVKQLFIDNENPF